MTTETLPTTADELTHAQAEFVAEYMRTGNATQAYKSTFDNDPARTYGGLKVAASRLLRHPPVAARIRYLRSVAAEAVANDTRAMALRLHELATASPADLMEVVAHACRVCSSADGRTPAWESVEEFSDACESWQASLQGPKPLRKPSAAGGFNHDPFASPNPFCKACRGRGETTLHVRPTSEWSDAARALFDGAVVDDTGRVSRLLFQDRTKYHDMLHKLLGAYAPVKTESKSLNVSMSATEAAEIASRSPEEIVSILWGSKRKELPAC